MARTLPREGFIHEGGLIGWPPLVYTKSGRLAMMHIYALSTHTFVYWQSGHDMHLSNACPDYDELLLEVHVCDSSNAPVDLG